MSESPHILLGQLENKYIRKKISYDEYKSLKWNLMVRLHEQIETVNPVFREKRSKELTGFNNAPFYYIPRGPFMFGDDNEYAEITSGIYIGKYPVTVKEFVLFLNESDWEYSDSDIEQLYSISPEENCPASYVSWLDAKEYCRWLRSKTNEYYSLPNELEWEIAARGIDGRPYPWGYQEPDGDLVCAQGDIEYEHTSPVGNFPENKSPFGCMDMAGNVWEWCIDAIDDPNDPHILRGGSWMHDIEHSNCTSKIISYPPEKRVDYGGFRVIYLPGDLLEEYRKQAESDESQPEVKLKVLSSAPIESNDT